MFANPPGELFALLAALTWAFAMVLFKFSGEIFMEKEPSGDVVVKEIASCK